MLQPDKAPWHPRTELPEGEKTLEVCTTYGKRGDVIGIRPQERGRVLIFRTKLRPPPWRVITVSPRKEEAKYWIVQPIGECLTAEIEAQSPEGDHYHRYLPELVFSMFLGTKRYPNAWLLWMPTAFLNVFAKASWHVGRAAEATITFKWLGRPILQFRGNPLVALTEEEARECRIYDEWLAQRWHLLWFLLAMSSVSGAWWRDLRFNQPPDTATGYPPVLCPNSVLSRLQRRVDDFLRRAQSLRPRILVASHPVRDNEAVRLAENGDIVALRWAKQQFLAALAHEKCLLARQIASRIFPESLAVSQLKET